MAERVYPILKAVAYHPTMLFVPAEVAALNIAANFVLMAIFVAVLDYSPMPFFITIVASHIALAFLYTRDSHMVTLAKAIGGSRKRSRNIVPCRTGVKYVP